MQIDWLTVAASVATTGTALGVAGFLGRTVVQLWLDKQLERYVHEMVSASARELEHYRDELRGVAFLREMRFSKWHDRRVEVMAELYRRFARADMAFRDLTHPIQQVAPLEIQTPKEKAMELGNAYFEYFNENDLFLNAEVAGAAQQFWETMRRTWSEFSVDPKGENWTKAWKDYTANAAILRMRITAAIRDVIGEPDEAAL